MSRTILPTGALVAALVLSPGCHSHMTVMRKSPAVGVGDAVRLDIIAAVLVHMGQSQEARLQGDTLLLLKLNDPDYVWVSHKFQLAPPPFRYAQLPPSARPSHGEEVLSVELDTANATHATARGKFVTDNSIAVFKYELVLGPKGWEVASSELFFAT